MGKPDNITSYPSSSIRQTSCWMAAFNPGTSPPPVRMPTRFAILLPYIPPTATMRSIRSTTRFEYPHSLSYHATTFT